MPKRPAMTGWYDPLRLSVIAMRAAISTIFGEFADRREALAISRPFDPTAPDPAYDYSGEQQGFWLDFMADTGDGWNPTYAMARLLAAPELEVEGLEDRLPIGSVLVMGGDQVYPTASRDDYTQKLVQPFEAAKKSLPEEREFDLYAIPGNHDWYDGLLAFLGLFCRRRTKSEWSHERKGRRLGGRLTKQTRSYFALKLPHGWWLWGADIQLEGYIDQPQIDFFQHVASEWMAPGSRLILCTGKPSWVYADPSTPEQEFKNYAYLEAIAGLAHRNHKLCLVLTGDSHHYARYVEGDCHYITAGGGGAFLHPTHQLKDKRFDWKYPRPGVERSKEVEIYKREFRIASDDRTGEPSLFPDRKISRRLAWRNLAFAWLNPRFAVTLMIGIGIFTWLLSTNASINVGTLSSALGSASNVWAALGSYFRAMFVSPWPSILALVAGVGYVRFAKFKRKWLAGGLHALCQAGVVVVSTIALAQWISNSDLWLIFAVGGIGGVLASTVMGVYLLVSLNGFGEHWNEAYSSLRIEDFKCFLRMHFGPDGGLSVYPIGLTRVPRDDSEDGTRDPRLRPHLIEGPILIGAALAPK